MTGPEGKSKAIETELARAQQLLDEQRRSELRAKPRTLNSMVDSAPPPTATGSSILVPGLAGATVSPSAGSDIGLSARSTTRYKSKNGSPGRPKIEEI